MKRFGEIIALNVSILNLPGIVSLAFPGYFLRNTTLVWIIVIILAIAVSITQIEFPNSPKTAKLFRALGFHLFKARTIAILLLIQLLIALAFLIFQIQPDKLSVILISLAINLIGINLLIISEKLSNSDLKVLLFRNPRTGCVYLYFNNKIRYIPDPPTFNLLGLSWSEITDLNDRQLDAYQMLTPITSVKEMKLYNYKNYIYGLVNDKLKHIPNEYTLNYIRQIGNNTQVEAIDNLHGRVIDKPFESYQNYL
ncbi:MAG TPA: hypothetical protein VGI43_05365 [Mucilaginibacter sp.]|jgi:hypothetical protein